jgi:hypothetical protein
MPSAPVFLVGFALFVLGMRAIGDAGRTTRVGTRVLERTAGGQAGVVGVKLDAALVSAVGLALMTAAAF